MYTDREIWKKKCEDALRSWQEQHGKSGSHYLFFQRLVDAPLDSRFVVL